MCRPVYGLTSTLQMLGCTARGTLPYCNLSAHACCCVLQLSSAKEPVPLVQHNCAF